MKRILIVLYILSPLHGGAATVPSSRASHLMLKLPLHFEKTRDGSFLTQSGGYSAAFTPAGVHVWASSAARRATRMRLRVDYYSPNGPRGEVSSGRCRALSGNLLTSSMIFAKARVEACRPVHGTVSEVSQSVWK